MLGDLSMLVVLHATCKPCWRCEPKIPPRCSTLKLDRCKAARCCGHHSTGWAARHMHASLKVRTEFPTLILHSKLGIVVKPGRRLNLPCWPSCTSHVGADGGASRISYPVPPLENAVFGTVPAFPPRLQSAGRQAVWGTRGAPSTRQFMFISPRD